MKYIKSICTETYDLIEPMCSFLSRLLKRTWCLQLRELKKRAWSFSYNWKNCSNSTAWCMRIENWPRHLCRNIIQTITLNINLSTYSWYKRMYVVDHESLVTQLSQYPSCILFQLSQLQEAIHPMSTNKLSSKCHKENL